MHGTVAAYAWDAILENNRPSPVHEAFSKHLGSGCIRTARSAPMALRRSAAGAREAWEATSGNLESQIGYEVFSQFEYSRSLNPTKDEDAQGWAYGIPLIRAYCNNIVRPRELGVLPRSPTRTPAERRYGISFCIRPATSDTVSHHSPTPERPTSLSKRRCSLKSVSAPPLADTRTAHISQQNNTRAAAAAHME